MTTKRTPIKRDLQQTFTPRAVELFRAMEELECESTCTPVARCSFCDTWWKLNAELHGEMRLRPWDWPAVFDGPWATDAQRERMTKLRKIAAKSRR